MGLHGLQGLKGLHGLVVAGGAAVTYKSKVLGYSPIAYWIMGEAAGGTSIDEINSPAQDGAYTGVTLGQTGIGDGNTSPLFDGANDLNNIYTTTFRDAFNGAEGTMLIWVKVSGVGVWTDGSARKCVHVRADNNNYVLIDKASNSNRFDYEYMAGGTLETIHKSSISDTDWICAALTWSKTDDEVKAYFNGVQEGITQTALGIWAGLPISTVTVIGAYNATPLQVWDGWLAHCAVWDSALAPADIADLAVIP